MGRVEQARQAAREWIAANPPPPLSPEQIAKLQAVVLGGPRLAAPESGTTATSP